jgi:hypothetical protein
MCDVCVDVCACVVVCELTGKKRERGNKGPLIRGSGFVLSGMGGGMEVASHGHAACLVLPLIIFNHILGGVVIVMVILSISISI